MRYIPYDNVGRTISSLMILTSIVVMLSMFDSYRESTKPIPRQPAFINNASTPPCIDDLNALPIFQLSVLHKDGTGVRGTAFLVDETHWVTAAHVVDGDVLIAKINTPNGDILGDVDFADFDADIAIIKTEKIVDWAPLKVQDVEPKFMDNIWSIGYPGWAVEQQVVSAGMVIGHSQGMIYTNAMVMGGMSGGPTLSCGVEEIEVSSVISSYSKVLHTEEVTTIGNTDHTEKVYINTGESFSALLSAIERVF